jgi:hypothetical protein
MRSGQSLSIRSSSWITNILTAESAEDAEILAEASQIIFNFRAGKHFF